MRARTGLRIALYAILSLVLPLFYLTACGSAPRAAPHQEDEFYQPPPHPTPTRTPNTPTATANDQAELVVAVPSASPTPGCTNLITFVEDLTIPDGTRVLPQEVLDKRWRMENTGTCNWDERYRIRLLAGEAMGAAAEQALFPALGGSIFEIQIAFTAPQPEGEYRSAWQAYDPQGQPFGDPFFMEIVVEEGPGLP